MVTIQIEDDRLALMVEGWDKLWALRGRLEIPLAHVRAVRADPEAVLPWLSAVKLGGTHLPGVISAGSFYQWGDGLVFWDVHDAQHAIAIDLDHERYRRLIVEVDDPEAAVRTIEQAIAGTGPRG